jgi:signal transduction histidine kinase
LGIFTVPYIDRYLRRKTDKFFFKDAYNYADALYGLSEKINQSVLIEDIKDLTEKTLQTILKTSTVTTSFVSRHQTSEVLEAIANHPNKTTLLVPIVFNETIIGTIFLGEKKSGDDYTHEDVVLIKTFSHQIALAFEKARLFKEVQEHSRELEQRVADRTHQIQKLQEQQTQMMLDISHKLQNPLTIVKTELELLRKQMPWKKEFAFFEKTIDDISLFIYDLLHLARFEAEEHHPKEQHDLSEHLLELLEYFETIADQSSITLEGKIAPDIHFVYSKKEMTELLTNLVSNAIKYMGETNGRERRITVTLTEDSGTITLAVADTGVGIDEKELPHIFERFYRAGAISATTIKGTGLGLAISKKIVEVHNGTISAQSAKGSGTIFTVVFQKS